jgi:hypothetical protein
MENPLGRFEANGKVLKLASFPQLSFFDHLHSWSQVIDDEPLGAIFGATQNGFVFPKGLFMAPFVLFQDNRARRAA